MSPDRQRRVYTAILENIDKWIADLQEIEADTKTGDKLRILHLMHNMVQARFAVERLMRDLDQSQP